MNNKKLEKLSIAVSTRGIPCLWENGGKKTDIFGQSFIIADKYAKAKKPLYVHSNPKPNSGHALIPVRVHDIVVICKIKEDKSTVHIYSITDIDIDQKVAYVNMINSFEKGEWSAVPNVIYDKVIEVAKEKAKEKDCIRAMYILPFNPENKETEE